MINKTLHNIANTLQEVFLAGNATSFHHPQIPQLIAELSPFASGIAALERLQTDLKLLSQTTGSENIEILIRCQSLVLAMLYTQTQCCSEKDTQTFVVQDPIDFTEHLQNFTLNELVPLLKSESASGYKREPYHGRYSKQYMF